MSDTYRLYHMPAACSRVTMNALEEIGVPFELKVIAHGTTRGPDYLAVNPNGRVPALKIGDRILTENAAILHFLDRRFPEARLLPEPADVPLNATLEDLVWCSSTLHAAVRPIRVPARFSDEGHDAIRAKGIEELAPLAARAAERVADAWWYGGEWSIVDAYLAWCFVTAAGAGFALPEALDAHAKRVHARGSWRRALERERTAVERQGIPLPPGMQL